MLASVSRLIGDVVSPEVRAGAQQLRAALAALRAKEDLISIGAYQHGTDPLVDAALAHRHEIDGFLRQAVEESSSPAQADQALLALAGAIEAEVSAHMGVGATELARAVEPAPIDRGDEAIPSLSSPADGRPSNVRPGASIERRSGR